MVERTEDVSVASQTLEPKVLESAGKFFRELYSLSQNFEKICMTISQYILVRDILEYPKIVFLNSIGKVFNTIRNDCIVSVYLNYGLQNFLKKCGKMVLSLFNSPLPFFSIP